MFEARIHFMLRSKVTVISDTSVLLASFVLPQDSISAGRPVITFV